MMIVENYFPPILTIILRISARQAQAIAWQKGAEEICNDRIG